MQNRTDKTDRAATGIFGGQKCRSRFVSRQAISVRQSWVGRVTPCAPWLITSAAGAHGVTRPTACRPSRGFTVVELLVVISIMGIIAALVVGLGGMASGKKNKANVSNQLAQLITAIESYKSKVGYYPPDNPAGPGTNQLYYELSGTVYLAASTSFQDRDGNILPAATVALFFGGVTGFVNADEAVRPPVPNFIKTFKTNQWAAINVGTPPVYVLKVPVKGTNGTVITWNYVSTAPTNNPRSFDLWADFPDGTNTVRISNWNRQSVIVN